MDNDFDCQLEFNKENEIQMCEVSEREATTTTTEQSNNSVVKSDTNKERCKKPPSKSKRVSILKKQWIKDPKYARFLQESKANSYFAHCSVCKSDFYIANGGIYMINRHIDQVNHKRLVALADKEKCNASYRHTLIDFFPHLARLMLDFITPSSVFTKMTATELSLVYHGLHHAHSYVSQSCGVVLKKIFHESVI
jgi:hypothetical protein